MELTDERMLGLFEDIVEIKDGVKSLRKTVEGNGDPSQGLVSRVSVLEKCKTLIEGEKKGFSKTVQFAQWILSVLFGGGVVFAIISIWKG